MMNPAHNLEQFGLQPGMVVADLGAGSGFYTIEAARLVGKEGKVIAVDVQKELLDKIKKAAQDIPNSETIEVLWGNIEIDGGSHIQDNAVDAAIVSNTLFQASDAAGIARETARVVKPGGKLLVVDWSDSHEGLGPHPDHVVPKETARELFELVGFQHTYDINAGEHLYGFVMIKEKSDR